MQLRSFQLKLGLVVKLSETKQLTNDLSIFKQTSNFSLLTLNFLELIFTF